MSWQERARGHVSPVAAADQVAVAPRGEVAIGLRRAARARTADAAYGVVVDPPKHAPIRLVDGDKVIVLAAD